MTDTALFSLLLILVAPVVGSFLGVVIDRLPRGISVVAPRSACRSCGTILGAKRGALAVLLFLSVLVVAFLIVKMVKVDLAQARGE